MKYLKKFEDISEEGQDLIPPEQIVDKYCKKYPNYEYFFRKFNEKFPDRETFEKYLLTYIDEDYQEEYEDDDTDETILDKHWRFDIERKMLNREIGMTCRPYRVGDFLYPGDDIYNNFYNEIEDSWYNFRYIKKYNL